MSTEQSKSLNLKEIYDPTFNHIRCEIYVAQEQSQKHLIIVTPVGKAFAESNDTDRRNHLKVVKKAYDNATNFMRTVLK